MPRELTLIALLSATLVTSCALGEGKGMESPPDAAELDRLRQKHRVSTLGVGVLRQGKLVWSGFYGTQAPGIQASDRTMFNVASIAKAVTTETVLCLVDRGQLDLDESLAEHWVDPDLRDDPRHRQLTPRSVLTHRTGFPNWRYLTEDKLSFQREPNAGFGYSGEGFEYLRRAVEAKLNRKFEDLAQELVFRPLGMRGTALVMREDCRQHLVHPRAEEGPWDEPNVHPPGQANAADDLFITIHDYAALLGKLWRDQQIRSALDAAKMTIQTEIQDAPDWRIAPTAPRRPTRYGFGLGWLVFEWGAERIVWHGGNDKTEHAIGYINPATGDGALVFTNGARGLPLMLDVLDRVDRGSPIAQFYRSLLAAAERRKP